MQFYCENITQTSASIEGEEAHHIINVLRFGPGDEVTLFNGQGTIAQAFITKLSRNSVDLTVKSHHQIPNRSDDRVIIVASVAKGERFDWLITKCTELGADHICPVIFERTVKLAKGTSTQSRYQKLSLAAAKQSYRPFLPQIDEPLGLQAAIAKLKTQYPGAHLLFGSTDPASKSILGTITLQGDYIAFVGPEGGFTSAEESMLLANGCTGVKLTATILRIETAAIAFAGLLCTSRDSRKPA